MNAAKTLPIALIYTIKYNMENSQRKMVDDDDYLEET